MYTRIRTFCIVFVYVCMWGPVLVLVLVVVVIGSGVVVLDGGKRQFSGAHIGGRRQEEEEGGRRRGRDDSSRLLDKEKKKQEKEVLHTLGWVRMGWEEVGETTSTLVVRCPVGRSPRRCCRCCLPVLLNR